jgi:TolA-binding protein
VCTVEFLVWSGTASVKKVLATNRLILLLGILAIASCPLLVSLSSPAQGQPSDEASVYSVAVQAYRDGLLDLARDQLQIYLAAYPQGEHVAEAHYLLGDYSFRKGNFRQALQHVRDALQHQLPAMLHADASYLLGRSAFEIGQYAEALEAFRPLIEAAPSGRWQEAALYWSGEALLRLDDFPSAARQLELLVERYPHTEYLESALYALGYARQKGAALGPSLDAFEQLLQRFPQSQLAHAAQYAIARALVALQRFAEAAPYWERISAAAPSPAEAEEATFWWAESWTRAERCDQARPAFQGYLQRFPEGRHRSDALATVAMCAHAVGAFAEEIAAREAFLQQFPDDVRSDAMLLHLAEAYEQRGEPAHARELYAEWLRKFPSHAQRADVLIRHGVLSRAQGDEARATEDFAEVLRQTNDPHMRSLAHAVLADSYVRLGDCAAALPHLSGVIEQGDQSARQQARWRRGVCAYRNKAFAAAVEDFRQLVDDTSFGGDRQSLLLLLGQSLAALNRDAEAVDPFRRFLTAAPPDETAAQALAGLGASLLKIGQVEAALPVYEQLLAVAPELPAKERLHLQLALLYLERRETDQAKRHLSPASNGLDVSVAAEATYRLADLLFAEGMEVEAIALLHKLTTQLTSQPAWVGIASYRLALVYEAKERWPEAWQAYVTAVNTATDPQLVEAARQRAQHLEETVDVHARREPASSQAERNL